MNEYINELDGRNKGLGKMQENLEAMRNRNIELEREMNKLLGC
jgi:hypothetical protein